MTTTTKNAAVTPTVLDRYVALADRFGAVVDSLPPDAWDAPSACEGWSGRDVVDHVVASQRGFLEARGVIGGDPMESVAPPSDPAGAWHTHDDEMRRLLADPAVTDLAYDGMLGRTTVGATVVNFYGFDLIIHRWDLAQAAGRDERLTEEELDSVENALPAFGEHLYDDGVCKPAVTVPDDADRQAHVLGRLGRTAPRPV